MHVILWWTLIRLTALDISMINGHTGCASYLIACHAPSGGGAYHRAAATIQAVWRYHKFKVQMIMLRLCQWSLILYILQCQRDISRYWSAAVIQRCVCRWLWRVKAARVRQARLAARNRAACTIQLKWKEYIVEKRRYEATYSRLKARLRQEQLAASLIIAELQAQTQSISLPPAKTTVIEIPLRERAFRSPSTQWESSDSVYISLCCIV